MQEDAWWSHRLPFSEGYLGMADTSSAKMLSDLQKHHRKIARKQSSG